MSCVYWEPKSRMRTRSRAVALMAWEVARRTRRLKRRPIARRSEARADRPHGAAAPRLHAGLDGRRGGLPAEERPGGDGEGHDADAEGDVGDDQLGVGGVDVVLRAARGARRPQRVDV